jgi:hypothetical protein
MKNEVDLTFIAWVIMILMILFYTMASFFIGIGIGQFINKTLE